jgi:hypothetical protein
MKYDAEFEYATLHSHGGLFASPTLSISSALLFSVDSQPEHCKRLAYSLENIGGIPPKSESQAKPLSQNGTPPEKVSTPR